MKRILLLILILISVESFSQGWKLKVFKVGNVEYYQFAPPTNYSFINGRYRWLATMADSGMHVPSYNGTPVGTRVGVWPHDGAIAMDTTNHRFYIYSGGAWIRQAAFSEIVAGYTTLSQFVDETAWRTFYSNGSGDVTPLAFGTSGQVLTSNGVSAAPTWETVTAYTASNGLTLAANDFKLGGSLTANTTVALGANNLNFSTSGGIVGIGTTSPTPNTRLDVIATTSVTGINANSPDGNAIVGNVTTGSSISAGITGTATGVGLAGLFYVYTSGTNDIVPVTRIQRQTTATAANGLGGSLDFYVETDGGTNRLANQFISKWTTIADASRTSQVDITGVNAATTETYMNIQTGGIVRVNNLADTLATKAYARSVGGGGGSGNVTKVGTPVDNQVGVWTGDGTIEGDADLTFDGTSALAIGGVAVPTISSTNTFTNKRWTARVGSTTSSGTPTINTDDVDIYKITALTTDITSFTTNLSGTPVDGDILEIQITGTASRALTFGASFVSTTTILPVSTSGTTTLTVIFQYYTTSSYGNNKWHCVSYY